MLEALWQTRCLIWASRGSKGSRADAFVSLWERPWSLVWGPKMVCNWSNWAFNELWHAHPLKNRFSKDLQSEIHTFAISQGLRNRSETILKGSFACFCVCKTKQKQNSVTNTRKGYLEPAPVRWWRGCPDSQTASWAGERQLLLAKPASVTDR